MELKIIFMFDLAKATTTWHSSSISGLEPQQELSPEELEEFQEKLTEGNRFSLERHVGPTGFLSVFNPFDLKKFGRRCLWGVFVFVLSLL